MKKKIFLSMIIVFISTLFLLIFFSGGLVILDKLARSTSVEAKFEQRSIDHSFINKTTIVKSIQLGQILPRFVLQEEITIAFAGDINMQGSIERAMNKYEIDYPFLHVKEELQKADYSIINLETAVTNRGTPYSKQYNFRTGVESLIALKDAGFDSVSLANNHSMDYGVEGMVDTLGSLNDIGLSYIGAGKNSQEAYKPEIITVKGRKIALLGFSRVLPTVSWYAGPTKPGVASGYQLERMTQIVKAIKQEVDFVFVYMHWGIERNQTPEPYQFHDARILIDAGADGIVGAHPHVIQGLDYYNGKPIAYSIGNFLFPDYVKGLTAESSVLTMVIRKDEIKMRFTPYDISGNQVVKVTEEIKEARLVALEKLSYNIKRVGNIFSNP